MQWLEFGKLQFSAIFYIFFFPTIFKEIKV